MKAKIEAVLHFMACCCHLLLFSRVRGWLAHNPRYRAAVKELRLSYYNKDRVQG